MKRYLIFTFFFLFICFGCKKESSDYRASGANTVVIKGFQVRNEVGQHMADIGFPDIRLVYPVGSEGHPDLAIASFPVPARNEIDIVMRANFQNETGRLWIVPASFSGSEDDIPAFLGTTLVSPANRPVFDTSMIFNFSTRHLMINIPNEGFYRVYFKSHGCLVWDNIVISQADHQY